VQAGHGDKIQAGAIIVAGGIAFLTVALTWAKHLDVTRRNRAATILQATMRRRQSCTVRQRRYAAALMLQSWMHRRVRRVNEINLNASGSE